MARRQDNIETKLVRGLIKATWWLVSLPFMLLTKRPAGSRANGKHVVDKQLFRGRWQDIKHLAETQGQSNFAMAIFEADKMFDQALKVLGVPGETMGERLKSASDLMSPDVYDGVWQAHKLRNTLAHEMNSEALSWDVKDALLAYERGLLEIGVL